MENWRPRLRPYRASGLRTVNAISEAISKIVVTENPCSGYCDRSIGRSHMTWRSQFESQRELSLLPATPVACRPKKTIGSSHGEGHGHDRDQGQDQERTGD